MIPPPRSRPQKSCAVDENLNFGDFWNEEGFAVERDTILSLNKDVKSLFNSSYKGEV
jgi:hypothetical protein